MLPATYARLDEKVTCEAISPHLYLLSFMLVQCYPPLQQLYSDIGDMTLLTAGTGILRNIGFASGLPGQVDENN